MLDEQLFHFVDTDWVFGIQDREVTLAIDVLENKEPHNSMMLNHVLLFKRWLKLKGYDSDIDEIYEKYKNGEDVYLECYCKPLPCHGDIIAEKLQKRMIREKFAEIREKRKGRDNK